VCWLNTRLTNNYQAKQIIWQDETKHEGISVNTTKDQLNEDRSTILVATPVTKNMCYEALVEALNP
jgi:hypothetical protein